MFRKIKFVNEKTNCIQSQSYVLHQYLDVCFNCCLNSSLLLFHVEICVIVGKLSRSQLSKDQVRVYINEENNRRRNLLIKYIRLCNDAKVLQTNQANQMLIT